MASIAYKTAFRHYSQYLKAPIPGVSISQLEANRFHVNTLVLEGPYKGITIHWELKIPEDYPHSPPYGAVAKGYAFDENHHHHVFGNGVGICCDVLANFKYMHDTAGGYSGWTPAANFTTLMIYLQPFFADPDGRIASKTTLNDLFTMDGEYSCEECGHSTKNPVPPLHSKEEADIDELAMDISKLSVTESRAHQQIVCPVLGQSIIDDPTIVMGYPMKIHGEGHRMTVELFPEFLSYTAYHDAVEANKNRHPMRTSTGHNYTHWLPLYLNSKHFERSKKYLEPNITLLNSETSIGLVDLLVKTMNKQVLAVMNGSSHESEPAIVAYANLLRLLREVLKMSPNRQSDIDSIVRSFLNSPAKRNKKSVPDLGEFYIKLCVSTVASIDDLTVREKVIRETFARQIRWIRQANAACVDDPDMPIKTRLKLMFEHSLVSNRISTFVMEMAKVFGTPSFCNNMDRCFGMPPATIITGFQDRVKLIKANLVTYDVLVRGWNLQSIIRNQDDMLQVMLDAKAQSAKAGYDGKPNRRY